MSEQPDQSKEQAAAYQKIWAESLAKVMEAACTFSPNSPPPELLKQIRSGMFEALAKSWEEFMRSPQFLQGMKQMMENAIAFRKMSGDFLAKARQEFDGSGREDADDLLLAMREMEARLTRRVDDLAARIPPAASRPARSPVQGKQSARRPAPKAQRRNQRKPS